MTEDIFRKKGFKAFMFLDYINKSNDETAEGMLLEVDFEKQMVKLDMLPTANNEFGYRSHDRSYWLPISLVEFQKPKLKVLKS